MSSSRIWSSSIWDWIDADRLCASASAA